MIPSNQASQEELKRRKRKDRFVSLNEWQDDVAVFTYDARHIFTPERQLEKRKALDALQEAGREERRENLEKRAETIANLPKDSLNALGWKSFAKFVEEADPANLKEPKKKIDWDAKPAKTNPNPTASGKKLDIRRK